MESDSSHDAVEKVRTIKMTKTTLVEDYFRTEVLPECDIDERFPEFVRFDRVKDLKAAKAEYDEFLNLSQADSPLYRSCSWSLFKTYDSIYLAEL